MQSQRREMPPYHSSLTSPGGRAFGNVALMPLRQTSKGSARGPAPQESGTEDIVDEALNLFKVISISSRFTKKCIVSKT